MTAMVQAGAGPPVAAAPKRARARAKPAAPRRSAATAAPATAGDGDGDGDVGSAVLAPGRMPIPMVDEQGNPLSKEQALARPHLGLRLRPSSPSPPLPWLPPSLSPSLSSHPSPLSSPPPSTSTATATATATHHQIRAYKLRARMDRKADSARQARRRTHPHTPAHTRTRPHTPHTRTHRTPACTAHPHAPHAPLTPHNPAPLHRCTAAPLHHASRTTHRAGTAAQEALSRGSEAGDLLAPLRRLALAHRYARRHAPRRARLRRLRCRRR